MKWKAYVIVVSVMLSLLLCAGSALAGPTKFDALETQGTTRDEYNFKGANSAGTSTFSVDKQGNVGTKGSLNMTGTGGLEISGASVYFPNERVVTINKGSQLSSFSGAAAGSSYYQTEPGKTYLVDLHALSASGVTTGNGVSAFANFSLSAVTFILPNAAVYYGPAYDVTIMAVSATTSFTHQDKSAGTTQIVVHPFAGTSNQAVAGVTKYGGTQDLAYLQNMRTIEIRSFVRSQYKVAAGTSYWEVSIPGEAATFGLDNGAVSAFPKWRNIFK